MNIENMCNAGVARVFSCLTPVSVSFKCEGCCNCLVAAIGTSIADLHFNFFRVNFCFYYYFE